MPRLLLALAFFLLSSGVASAAPRLAVAPLRGKGGAQCAEQVAETIAKEGTVIPWTEVKTGSSFRTYPELAAWLEKRQNTIGADVVIFGNVLGTSIILEAYSVEKRALIGLTKIATRGGCRLTRRGFARIRTWSSNLTAMPASPPPPALPPPPPPSPPPPPPPIEDDFDVIEEAPPPPVTTTATAPAVVVDGLEPSPRVRRPLLVEAEIDLGVHRRTLGFGGVATRNLRAFDIGAMPVAGVSVRAFFLRGLKKSWLDPLFLRARYASAAFITARRPDGGPSHQAVHDRVEARIGYRFRVPASVPILVSPSVGLHVMRFLVRDEPNTPELDLPDVAYVSAHLGGDLEARVAPRATLALSAAFLPVLSGGPIFGPGYFESGSANGLTVEAGLRYTVLPRVGVFMMGDFLTYSLSLDAPADATRVARTGSDTVLGVRIGTRVSF